MGYTTKTPIQATIERNVTGGRGYNPCVASRIPQYLQETEIGLQLALLNMDLRDNKMLWNFAYVCNNRIENLIEKLEKAGLPLDTITSPEGIRAATRLDQHNISSELQKMLKEPLIERLSKESSYFVRRKTNSIDPLPLKPFKEKIPSKNSFTDPLKEKIPNKLAFDRFENYENYPIELNFPRPLKP